MAVAERSSIAILLSGGKEEALLSYRERAPGEIAIRARSDLDFARNLSAGHGLDTSWG
jgi:hypothetical protein